MNTDITPHLWIGKVPGLAWLMFKVGRMPRERYAQHREGVFSRLQYLDLTKKLPYADNAIEAIFSSHVFEHLFMDEVERLVDECFRVLKPGGVVRVVVPDLEKIMKLYDANDPREFLASIYEVATRSAVKNSHHSGFTGAFISRLFQEAGFTKCSVLEYKSGQCPDLNKLDNRPDSLFFEAIK